MKECGRFEEEGLLQLERGLPLDPHFSSCPDCIESARKYAHLQQILRSDAAVNGCPNWKQEVWTQIESPSKTRWRRYAGVAAAALMVAVLVTISQQFQEPAEVPSVRYSIESSGAGTTRSEGASLGDILHITGTTGNYPHFKLRVYFNDRRVLLDCSEEAPCTRDGTTVAATLSMQQVGKYQAILLLSSAPIPPSVEDPDLDFAELLKSNGKAILGRQLDIR